MIQKPLKANFLFRSDILRKNIFFLAIFQLNVDKLQMNDFELRSEKDLLLHYPFSVVMS